MAKKRVTRKRTFARDGTESDLERRFLLHWSTKHPSHPPVTQLQFHPTRLWQFDFAWVIYKVAVEIQGRGPGHQSYTSMTKDYNKHIGAMQMGWKVIYLTSLHLLPEKIDAAVYDVAHILGILPTTPQPKGYVPLHKRK